MVHFVFFVKNFSRYLKEKEYSFHELTYLLLFLAVTVLTLLSPS